MIFNSIDSALTDYVLPTLGSRSDEYDFIALTVDALTFDESISAYRAPAPADLWAVAEKHRYILRAAHKVCPPLPGPKWDSSWYVGTEARPELDGGMFRSGGSFAAEMWAHGYTLVCPAPDDGESDESWYVRQD